MLFRCLKSQFPHVDLLHGEIVLFQELLIIVFVSGWKKLPPSIESWLILVLYETMKMLDANKDPIKEPRNSNFDPHEKSG